MLTAYINAAMRSAQYEILDGGQVILVRYPAFKGSGKMPIRSKHK
jgi:hypothetical protein